MRVITEERLDHLIKTDGDGSMVYCTVSRADLQEIDQLTVTRLRPMSDAPRDGTLFLAMFEDGNLFRECFYAGQDDLFMCDDYDEIADNFKGWIPLPTYKPEQS